MNKNKFIIIWLLSGCALIFIMVVVGGITRLTDSGLSMVKWNLFMGAIPPLNEIEWEATFNLYKAYPEYQKVNFNCTLSEFKYIFFFFICYICVCSRFLSVTTDSTHTHTHLSCIGIMDYHHVHHMQYVTCLIGRRYHYLWHTTHYGVI